jgi:o-succinylbenzoate synthase
VKLGAARASAVTLRFARPVRTAPGVFNERSSVILELRDADGVAGFGEAAPWPGFGTETAAESLDVLQRAQPLLCGEDLEPAQWPKDLASHFAFAPAARAALAGALWDVSARRAGRPLAHMLAECCGPFRGPVLASVPVSALLVESAVGALREAAIRAREAGHLAVKIKLGAAMLADDVARVAAVRDGLGPDIALRGDANGAWNEREAREAMAALAPFGLAYVEQPLPFDAIDALARLRRESPVRIAADESVSTPAGADRLLEAGAVDVLVLKPAMLGGAAPTLAIAARARQAGCEVVFTHAFESAVGARHVLHCAAAWGDPAAVHGLTTQGLFDRDVAEAVACRGGRVELSPAPGLGIAL